MPPRQPAYKRQSLMLAPAVTDNHPGEAMNVVKSFRGTGDVLDGGEPISTVEFRVEANPQGQVRAEPQRFRGSWLSKANVGSRVHIEVDAHHLLVGEVIEMAMPGGKQIGGSLRTDSDEATYRVHWTHLEDRQGNRVRTSTPG